MPQTTAGKLSAEPAGGEEEDRIENAVNQQQKLIAGLLSLRKRLLVLGGAIALTTFLLYFFTPQLFKILQYHLHQKLAFFTVAEPFLAHVKLAFFSALFLLMPLILHTLWLGLATPFGFNSTNRWFFLIGTVGLFYAGASFCYAITLPFGVDFLLGYGSKTLQPVISIDRFVSFFTIFVLAFGLIFELPVFMVFFAKAGLCPRRAFEKNRRYAILIISIAAALLTPTPDIVNMMLMGGPLYLLYEAGIVILRFMHID